MGPLADYGSVYDWNVENTPKSAIKTQLIALKCRFPNVFLKFQTHDFYLSTSI